MGQLTFPKCYLSSPLFVTGLFVAIAYVNHEVFSRIGRTSSSTFTVDHHLLPQRLLRRVFGTHFFLNWFLSMGHGDMEASEASDERTPLFTQWRMRLHIRTRRREGG